MTQGSFEETVKPPPFQRYAMEDVYWYGSGMKDKPRAVSSFSGAGGSCIGLRLAGFDVEYAIEPVPSAGATYLANFPHTYLDPRDIREVTGEEILDRLELAVGDLDLFEGSPPCASFSRVGAGKRLHGKKKAYSFVKGDNIEQQTDDLFFEWVRLVEEMSPKAFVAENVPGMVDAGNMEEYAWKVSERLSLAGYQVTARELNACHYGVPQDRRRLFFVGLRRDLNARFHWPRPNGTPPHTLRQALASVPATPEEIEMQKERSISTYAVGREWREMRHALALGKSYAPRYFSMVLPSLDRPCPTITATAARTSTASVCHPTSERKFTPEELKAIFAFPEDFVLCGEHEQQANRMGRAVPPPLMAAVAGEIREALREADA